MTGFVYRVALMAKILKCNRLKMSGNRWLEPEAGKLILAKYDFSWFKNFHLIIKTVILLMLIMGGLVIYQPIPGNAVN